MPDSNSPDRSLKNVPENRRRKTRTKVRIRKKADPTKRNQLAANGQQILTDLSQKSAWAELQKVFFAVCSIALTVLPNAVAWERGGVSARSQHYISMTLLLMICILLPFMVSSARVVRERTLWIPLVLAGIWITTFLQTIQIPGGLLAFIAPGSNAAYFDWIPEGIRAESFKVNLPNAESLASTWAPISIAPWLTTQALTALSLFSVTLVLSITLSKSRYFIALFLSMTCLSGAVMALFATLKAFYPNGSPLADSMFEATLNAKNPFGSFINANNAAGYLNAALACGIGWLIFLSTKHRELNRPGIYLSEQIGSWGERYLQALAARIRHLQGSTIAASLLCLLIVIGIVASGSRGGLLGTTCGFTVLFANFWGRKLRLKRSTTVITSTAIAVTVGLLVILGPFNRDFGRALADDPTAGSRIAHWRDATVTAWNHLPLGSGIGTYRYAYLPYQQHGDIEWFLNADNIYLEWIVEGGIWLLPSLAVICFIFATFLQKLERLNPKPQTNAILVSGWFLMISLGVSQAFDFALLIPANFIIVAVIAGSVIGCLDQKKRQRSSRGAQTNSGRVAENQTRLSKLPPRNERTKDPSVSNRKHRNEPPLQLASIVLLVFFAITLLIAQSQAKAASLSDNVPQSDAFTAGERFDEYTLDYLARATEQWVSQIPYSSTNPGLHLKAANLKLTQERYYLTNELQKLGVNYQTAWRSLQPQSLRRLHFKSLQKSSLGMPVRSLYETIPESSREPFVSARKHALEALLRCPLSLDARVALIELDFVSPEAASTSHDLMVQLAMLQRSNPKPIAWVRQLAKVHPGQKTIAAINRFALDQQPTSFPEIWTNVLQEVELKTKRRNAERLLPTTAEIDATGVNTTKPNSPEERSSLAKETLDFAINSIPENPTLLINAAEDVRTPVEIKTALLAKANELLSDPTKSITQDEQTDFEKGRLLQLQGSLTAATKHYETAIKADPGKHAWRFRLVQVLEQQQEYEFAEEHLKRCLLQSPGNEKYRKKLRALQTKTNTRGPG
ncbi:MAG: O-antigen ligase family protein [Rubripirellula sp.]|nr:O-antigen ligase family protein [Rubripirellula sp.]